MLRGIVVLAGIGLLAIGLALSAGAASTKPAATVTIQLLEVNGSGQHGVAILAPVAKKKDRYTVTVKMTKPVTFPGPRQRAHIHSVTCAEYAADAEAQGGTLYVPLNTTLKNTSVSVVYEPMALVRTGKFSINIHQNDPPFTVVACGDIPKA